MTKPNFSPAPWYFQYSPYSTQENVEIPNFDIQDAEGNKVCDTNENSSTEIQEANAQIIAAAPDLAEALAYAKKRIVLLEQYTEGKCDPSNLQMINEALIKAGYTL